MTRTIVQGSGMKRVAALADLHCPRTGEDVLRFPSLPILLLMQILSSSAVT